MHRLKSSSWDTHISYLWPLNGKIKTLFGFHKTHQNKSIPIMVGEAVFKKQKPPPPQETQNGNWKIIENMWEKGKRRKKWKKRQGKSKNYKSPFNILEISIIWGGGGWVTIKISTYFASLRFENYLCPPPPKKNK